MATTSVQPSVQPVSKGPSQPASKHPTALIHPTVSLTGSEPVTVGQNAIIQLRSRINSTYGPATIADGVLISERVSIGCVSAPSPHQSSDSTAAGAVSIGAYTIIESGAVVEAASIGLGCIIESRAKIGPGAVLGNGCKICALAEIDGDEVLGDGVVVFGPEQGGGRRIDEGMTRDGEGMRARKEMAEGLGDAYRRVWTGK